MFYIDTPEIFKHKSRIAVDEDVYTKHLDNKSVLFTRRLEDV